jgi:hypothetical protein
MEAVMSFRNDREACEAIRGFLAGACRGRLVDFWTAEGPTRTAVEYIEKGSPLSHGESLALQVAFDVWNGHGGAKVADLLGVLDNDNFRAVFDLLLPARSGARSK